MSESEESSARTTGWRQKLYLIIFEAETPLGRAFDIGLILAILASVGAVMLESVPALRAEYGDALWAVEWFFTIVFTLEYLTRLICARRPWRDARSFFGIVDLLAILPTYLVALFPGPTTSRSSACCASCAPSACSSLPRMCAKPTCWRIRWLRAGASSPCSCSWCSRSPWCSAR